MEQNHKLGANLSLNQFNGEVTCCIPPLSAIRKMNELKAKFSAPWGKELRWMTGIASSILVGVALIGIVWFPAEHPLGRITMVAIPLLVLAGSSLFVVRGYTLANQELIVHRLGWTTRLKLNSLQSVSHDPFPRAVVRR
jgi:hypothetical protein